MPVLEPFRGIRYSTPDELGDLVCPPYDIISPDEQERLHERHPHNAVRLELARGEGAGPDRYSEAAATFERWRADGVLIEEDLASFYVYRQDFTTAEDRRCRVAGTIGALKLEAFGAGSGVLPHERTMPGPIEDRLALLRALPVNVSPIYGIYRGGGAVAPFYDSLEHRPPLARFVDGSGILHRLWVVSQPGEVQMLASALAEHTLVIADGHHRYETALAYHHEQAGAPGRHGHFMCFCVDADAEELVVLPYNRAFKTAIPAEELIARLKDLGARAVEGDAADALASSEADHPFVFIVGDEAVLVEVSDDDVRAVVGDRHPAWRALDVVALHEVLFPRLFEGAAPELSFSKDPDEVRRLIGDEGWSGGVLLRALSAPQIVDVAMSGERMPQKASYFWPKALTGLTFRSLR